jgi:hypothetical protein
MGGCGVRSPPSTSPTRPRRIGELLDEGVTISDHGKCCARNACDVEGVLNAHDRE